MSISIIITLKTAPTPHVVSWVSIIDIGHEKYSEIFVILLCFVFALLCFCFCFFLFLFFFVFVFFVFVFFVFVFFVFVFFVCVCVCVCVCFISSLLTVSCFYHNLLPCLQLLATENFPFAS